MLCCIVRKSKFVNKVISMQCPLRTLLEETVGKAPVQVQAWAATAVPGSASVAAKVVAPAPMWESARAANSAPAAVVPSPGTSSRARTPPERGMVVVAAASRAPAATSRSLCTGSYCAAGVQNTCTGGRIARALTSRPLSPSRCLPARSRLASHLHMPVHGALCNA